MTISPAIQAEAERLLKPGPASAFVAAYRREMIPAVASALQAKQDEIERTDQLRIDEVSDAQSKAQEIYIGATEGNRGLKEIVKALEAVLVDAAEALEGIAELTWDKRDPCRHVCDEASMMANEASERARTALNPNEPS